MAAIGDAWRLAATRTEQIGPDWLIIGYPQKEPEETNSFEIDEPHTG